MRYIAYGLAIFVAAVFTVAFATGYLPRDDTVSHNETHGTMNVHELQTTEGSAPTGNP